MRKHGLLVFLLVMSACAMEVESASPLVQPEQFSQLFLEAKNAPCPSPRFFDGHPVLSFAELLQGIEDGWMWECGVHHLLIDTVRCPREWGGGDHDKGSVGSDDGALRERYQSSLASLKNFAGWYLPIHYLIDREGTACLERNGDLKEVLGLLRPTPFHEVTVFGDLLPRSRKLVEPPFYLGHDGPSIAHVTGWAWEIALWEDLPSPSLAEFTAETGGEPLLRHVAHTASGFETPREDAIDGILTPIPGVPSPCEPTGGVEIGPDPSVPIECVAFSLDVVELD